MKLKGYLKLELSREELQALLLAAQLELKRYKDIPLGDWTDGVRALESAKDRFWGYLHFSQDEDKRPITQEEWEAALFAARCELLRYKGIEVRHLRSDLQALERAFMDVTSAFKMVEQKEVG